ncbi:MAG: PspA/IM30 family protein [Deltaproteobacteria bacterium]|nr:PspA/IM30 family protein [Deltaproteobacteria bacterium]
MGIFSRLGTLIKSNLNDLISKAEDPEKMLQQVLIDMQSQLVEAKKQVAVAIADEKRLQKQFESEAERAKDWEKKAMLAVRSNDDGLAKEALARRQDHDNIASQYLTQWQAQKNAVEKLKDALRMLSMKIEEAKRKKNILIARKKRAEAQRTIQNTMAGLSDTSAFDTFARMSDRIDQMEAEAEAGAEIAGELSGDDLEMRFKKLEGAGSATSDAQLLELKAKMGVAGLLPGASPDQKQLGTGTPAAAGASAASAPAAQAASAPADSLAGSLASPDVMKEMEELDRQLEAAAKQAAAAGANDKG